MSEHHNEHGFAAARDALVFPARPRKNHYQAIEKRVLLTTSAVDLIYSVSAGISRIARPRVQLSRIWRCCLEPNSASVHHCETLSRSFRALASVNQSCASKLVFRSCRLTSAPTATTDLSLSTPSTAVRFSRYCNILPSMIPCVIIFFWAHMMRVSSVPGFFPINVLVLTIQATPCCTLSESNPCLRACASS